MTGGHNFPESQGSLFTAGGRHSCLWPKATRIYESKVPAKNGTSSHTMIASTVLGKCLPRKMPFTKEFGIWEWEQELCTHKEMYVIVVDVVMQVEGI